MANIKPKKNGYYKIVKEQTDIDSCGDNLIIFSVDTDYNNINYVISKKNYKEYLTKLLYLFDKKTFEKKEILEVLETDIYNIYKTKVSLKRIPQILLNVLVINDLIYSDNGFDYKIKAQKKDFINFINKI